MSTVPVVRPRQQIAPPKRLERAFDDPAAVVALIHRGAPYKTIAAVQRQPDRKPCAAWFRNFWALGGKVIFEGAEPFFRNPNFIAAAKQSFGAAVVRPWAMMTNLNLPAAGAPPHLDLPFFRGLNNREVPSWMLTPMGYSGLFHEWAIPVASAITWFYDGPGGEFEYWPDGLEAASRTVAPPYTNHCVVADNEYMYHRVGPTGLPDQYWSPDSVPYDARLALDDSGQWAVRDGERTLATLPYGSVRLSVLWKAFCFQTQEMADSYDDHGHDLTPGLVVDIFCDDLSQRGVAFSRPDDPANDPAWRRTLFQVYGAPDYLG
jgi:hypothetical protein